MHGQACQHREIVGNFSLFMGGRAVIPGPLAAQGPATVPDPGAAAGIGGGTSGLKPGSRGVYLHVIGTIRCRSANQPPATTRQPRGEERAKTFARPRQSPEDGAAQSLVSVFQHSDTFPVVGEFLLPASVLAIWQGCPPCCYFFYIHFMPITFFILNLMLLSCFFHFSR